jgi:ribose 5-phosphate isomerase A
MNPKQRAAEAAVSHLQDGIIVGLGTGSTADCFLQALAAALRHGRLRDIRGIPTSQQSERRARHLGIPLTTLAQHPHPDITVDGADEIAPNLDLIKGLGGALLREKIVAQSSRRLIIIGDAGKLVPRLGTRSPLPIEVAQFGHETHVDFLQSLKAQPVLRRTETGPFITDNGNCIYDCRFNGIDKPAALQTALATRAGIVESGLFLNMAALAIIGHEGRVETIERGA